MTQSDITPGQHQVTLPDGKKAIVDHFWISVIDGVPMIAGQRVAAIENAARSN